MWEDIILASKNAFFSTNAAIMIKKALIPFLRFFCPVFLLSILLNSSLVASAPTGSLHGIVTLGEDFELVQGVNVFIPALHLHASTDKQGNFRFDNVPEGVYDVEISLVGYIRQHKTGVAIRANAATELAINLVASPFQLNDVVVTGSFQTHLLKNTPVATEIISQQDLAATGSSDLGDVMRMQTGIEIGTSISQTQSVRLQGLSKNQVLVLVDGERVTGKVDDAIDLGQIPVNMIERIEIVKGPLSSIYGSDALGGVINLITKDARNSPTLHAGVTGGSNGRQDYEASAAYGFPNALGANNHLQVLANIGWNKYFGVEYDPTKHFMEIPENDRKNGNLKANLNFGGRVTVDLKADYYKDRLEWKAGTDGYYRFTDFSGNEKLSFSGAANVLLNDNTAAKVTASNSQNDHSSYEQNQFGSYLRNSKARETVRTFRAQVTTSPYQSSVFTAGYEGDFESANSSRIAGGFKDFANHVGYLEDEWTLSPVTLAIGGRYSNNSVYGSFFAPRISALYRANDNMTFRASYGRGYRSPSIMELYIDYDNAGVGYLVKGNPDLQPESSHGFNAGFDYNRDDLVWFRVNSYYNRVDNLINYFLVSQRPNVYSYHNITHAVTSGVDVDIDIHPVKELAVNIGYNYTSSKDDNGNPIPFVSPHSVTGRLTYTLGQRDLIVILKARWTDRKLVIDEQVNVDVQQNNQQAAYTHTADYVIFDTKVSKKLFSSFELFAGINNIADRTTYPFGQIKGREFFAGISFDYK